jgi:hypothetical protein
MALANRPDEEPIVPWDELTSKVGNWDVAAFHDTLSFGQKPEYSSDDMNGRCIIVRGISEGEFKSPKYPDGAARSILHNWPNELPTMAPWGQFFGSTSVPIKKLSQVDHFPVAVRLYKRKGAKFDYWDMEGYVPTFDDKGSMLDPNDDKVIQNFLESRKAVY